MFEGLVTSLLNRYLGEFVEGIDKNQLSVSVFAGKVSLENLKVKPDALKFLQLPIEVNAGSVGRILLKANWAKLSSEPVIVELSDVYVVASPLEKIRVDVEAVVANAISAKLDQLKKYEENVLAAEASSFGKETDGIDSGMVAKIIENLQLKISNIHIRYEEVMKTPEPQPDTCAAFGVCLKSFSIQSTDAEYVPGPQKPGKYSYKLVKLEDLSMYLSNPTVPVRRADYHKQLSSFFVDSSQKGNRGYLLQPVNGFIKIQINNEDEPCPKIKLESTVHSVGLTLGEQQYQDLLTIISSVSVSQAQLQAESSKHEPKFESGSDAVKDKYVKLYKRTLNATWLDAPSDADLNTLEEMEKKYEVDDLLIYRKIAYAQLRRELKDKPIEKRKKPKGVFSRMFGGSRQSDNPLKLSESEQKEIERLASQAKVLLGKPKEYVIFEGSFVMSEFYIALADNDKQEIIELVSKNSRLMFVQRTSSLFVDVKMGVIMLNDHFTPKTLYPQLLYTSAPAQPDPNYSSFHVYYEMAPIDSEADAIIRVELQPHVAVFSKAVIDRTIEFVTPGGEVNMSVLKDWAARALAAMLEAAKINIESSLDQLTAVDVAAKLQAPTLLIPENPSTKDTKSLLVLNMGRLLLTSDLIPSKQQAKLIKEAAGNLEQAKKEFKDSDFKEGLITKWLGKQDLKPYYHKYNVSVSDIEVFFSQGVWNHSASKHVKEHLVDPVCIDAVIGWSVVNGATWVPRFDVDVNSEGVMVSASPSKISRLTSIINLLMSVGSQVDTDAVLAERISADEEEKLNLYQAETLQSVYQQVEAKLKEASDEGVNLDELSLLLGSKVAKELIDDADVDGDGFVALDEFQDWWKFKMEILQHTRLVQVTYKTAGLSLRVASDEPSDSDDAVSENDEKESRELVVSRRRAVASAELVLALEGVEGVFNQLTFSSAGDFGVRAISIVDKVDPHGNNDFFTTSGASRSTSGRFIGLKLNQKTEDHPHFGDDPVFMSVDLAVGSVSVVVEPNMIYRNVDFLFNRLLTSLSALQTPESAAPADADKPLTQTKKKPKTEAHKRADKIGMQVALHFDALNVNIFHKATALSRLSISMFETKFVQYMASMDVTLSLSDITIEDQQPLHPKYGRILTTHHESSQDSLVSLKYSAFAEVESDYPGYGSELKGQFNGVRVIFINKYIQEMILVFTTGPMAQVQQVFAGGAEPTSADAAVPHDEVKEEPTSASVMIMDVHLNNVEVLVPKSSDTDELIVAGISKATVSSSKQTTSQGTPYTQMQASLDAFNIFSVLDKDWSPSPIMVLGPVEVTVDMLPTEMIVDGDLGTVNVCLSQPQYYLLLDTLQGNMAEETTTLKQESTSFDALHQHHSPRRNESPPPPKEGGTASSYRFKLDLLRVELVEAVARDAHHESVSFEELLAAGFSTNANDLARQIDNTTLTEAAKDMPCLVPLYKGRYSLSSMVVLDVFRLQASVNMSAAGAVSSDATLLSMSLKDTDTTGASKKLQFRQLLALPRRDDADGWGLRVHVDQPSPSEPMLVDVDLDYIRVMLGTAVFRLGEFFTDSRQISADETKDLDVVESKDEGIPYDKQKALEYEKRGLRPGAVHPDTLHDSQPDTPGMVINVTMADSSFHLVEAPNDESSTIMALSWDTQVAVHQTSDGLRVATDVSKINVFYVHANADDHNSFDKLDLTGAKVQRSGHSSQSLVNPFAARVQLVQANSNMVQGTSAMTLLVDIDPVVMALTYQDYEVLMQLSENLTLPVPEDDGESKDDGDAGSDEDETNSTTEPMTFGEQSIAVRLRGFRLSLINDVKNYEIPLARFSLRGCDSLTEATDLTSRLDLDQPMAFYESVQGAIMLKLHSFGGRRTTIIDASVAAEYYNNKLIQWEPLVEAFIVRTKVIQTLQLQQKVTTHLTLKTESELNVNLTHTLFDNCFESYKLITQSMEAAEKRRRDAAKQVEEENDAAPTPVRRSTSVGDSNFTFCPYRIYNATEYDLKVALASAQESKADGDQYIIVPPKSKRGFSLFEDLFDVQTHHIEFSFLKDDELLFKPVALTLDKVFVVTRFLMPTNGDAAQGTQVVAELYSKEGLKVLSVHSPFGLVNDSKATLEYRICKNETQSLGDYAGIVWMPLNPNEKDFTMQVRPSSAYEWSRPVEFNYRAHNTTTGWSLLECNSKGDRAQGETHHYSLQVTHEHRKSFLFVLRPPILVSNLLAVDCEMKYTHNPKQRERTLTLAQGEQSCLHGTPTTDELWFDLRLPCFENGSPWGQMKRIKFLRNDGAELQQTRSVNVTDDKGNVLVVSLELNFSGVAPAAMSLVIYCPYWIFDSTGFGLSLSADQKSNVPVHSSKKSVKTDNEKDLVPCYMYSYPPNYSKKNPTVRLSVNNRTWSDKLSLDAIGWSGAVSIKESDTPSSHKQLQEVEVGVTVRMSEGAFHRTKIVEISSRYMLVNKFQQPITVQQVGCPDEKQSVRLEPGEQVPFHWPDANKQKLIRFKVEGWDEWDYTGGFPVDQVEDLVMKLRPAHTSEAAVFVRAEIRIEDPLIFVMLGNANKRQAPFKIENRTVGHRLKLHQLEQSHYTFVNPYCFESFAWQEPTQKRSVEFSILDTPISKVVSLDTVFDPVRIDLDKKSSSKLYYHVESQGATKVLVLADHPHKKGDAIDLNSNLQAELDLLQKQLPELEKRYKRVQERIEIAKKQAKVIEDSNAKRPKDVAPDKSIVRGVINGGRNMQDTHIYCVVTFKGRKYAETSTSRKSHSPTWKTPFVVNTTDASTSDVLVVQIWEKNTLWKDTCHGQVEIHLCPDLDSHQQIEKWYQVHRISDLSHMGDVHLSLWWIPLSSKVHQREVANLSRELKRRKRVISLVKKRIGVYKQTLNPDVSSVQQSAMFAMEHRMSYSDMHVRVNMVQGILDSVSKLWDQDQPERVRVICTVSLGSQDADIHTMIGSSRGDFFSEMGAGSVVLYENGESRLNEFTDEFHFKVHNDVFEGAEEAAKHEKSHIVLCVFAERRAPVLQAGEHKVSEAPEKVLEVRPLGTAVVPVADLELPWMDANLKKGKDVEPTLRWCPLRKPVNRKNEVRESVPGSMRVQLSMARNHARPLDEIPETKFTIKLQHLGISMVDSIPREFLYVSFHNMSLEYEDSPARENTQLIVDHFQVDDQIPDARFPVVVAPVYVPPEDRQAVVQISVARNKQIDQDEYLQDLAQVDENVTVEEYNDNVQMFQYVSFLIQALDVLVSEDFVWRVLDFVNEFTEDQVEISGTSAILIDPIFEPEHTGNTRCLIPSVRPTDDNTRVDKKRVSFVTRSRKDLYRSPEAALTRLFFKMLQLQPIVVNVTFHADQQVRKKHSGSSKFSVNPFTLIMNMGGAALGAIDQAPIRLNALVMTDVVSTPPMLQGSLMAHYKRQGLGQVYKLIGSIELFGNPLGLVNNLGSGVMDFFYEPAKGLVKSPQDFGKGLAKGSVSLISNTFRGVFGGASKVTDSIGKGVALVSMDDEYIEERARGSSKSDNVLSGFFQGAKGLGMGIVKGVTGVVVDPAKGAKEDGVKGFVKGFGKGLLGVVAKPTAGALGLASSTLRGIGDTPKFLLQRGDKQCRIRPQRYIPPSTGHLRPYSIVEAKAAAAMRALSAPKEVNEEEYYVDSYQLIDQSCLIISNVRWIMQAPPKEDGILNAIENLSKDAFQFQVLIRDVAEVRQVETSVKLKGKKDIKVNTVNVAEAEEIAEVLCKSKKRYHH